MLAILLAHCPSILPLRYPVLENPPPLLALMHDYASSVLEQSVMGWTTMSGVCEEAGHVLRMIILLHHSSMMQTRRRACGSSQDLAPLSRRSILIDGEKAAWRFIARDTACNLNLPMGLQLPMLHSMSHRHVAFM